MAIPRLTRATRSLRERSLFGTTAASVAFAGAVLSGCGGESEPWALDPAEGGPGLEAPSLAPLVRPDTPGNNLLFNFDAGDDVETFGSEGGRFLVHFTRTGPNSVPEADTDASGVPDFVEQVADVYEEVLTVYEQDLGVRAPLSDEAIADNGGDGRFDVYLVDFAGQGDGHYSNDKCGPGNDDVCAGYMVQENDYKGYGYPSTLVANRILGSHEFFHAVQSAYDKGQGSVLAEGTAVWATERFDPSLKDFEAFLDGYFDNVDRPLDKPLPGAVDPFSYGAAIFFQFLTERYGATMVRSLLERTENGANGVADPVWFTELEPLLQAEAGVSFGDAFTEFATWNLFTTAKFADPARSYAAGAGYPSVAMSSWKAPYSDDELRVFYASTHYFAVAPDGRAAMTAALVAESPEEVDGLRLLVAPRTTDDYGEVKELADVEAGTEIVDTSSADRLVVFVVNELTSGDSRKPGICIGTVEEVAACRATLLGTGGAGGSGGMGGGGAGGTGDGAGGGGAAGGEGGGGSGSGASGGGEDDGGGCGCRTASTKEQPFAAALIAFAAGAVLRRRRAGR